jgi:hypothetical protein
MASRHSDQFRIEWQSHCSRKNERRRAMSWFAGKGQLVGGGPALRPLNLSRSGRLIAAYLLRQVAVSCDSDSCARGERVATVSEPIRLEEGFSDEARSTAVVLGSNSHNCANGKKTEQWLRIFVLQTAA